MSAMNDARTPVDDYPCENEGSQVKQAVDGIAGVPTLDSRELDEREAHHHEGTHAMNAEYSEVGDVAVTNSDLGGVLHGHQSSLRSVLEAIALKEKELRELQEREKSTESQLQLYSEVVGLRKELAVVKEDTARTKRQLEATNEIMKKYDPAVEHDIRALEEEAQQSSVQHVWTNVCQQRPDETLGDAASWVKVDIEDLPRRVAAAKEKLDAINTSAANVYCSREGQFNRNTDEREKAKARLRESIKGEMAKLKATRSRLKQLDQEQRHHFRRGTHVKQRMFSSQTEQDKLKQRVYDDEAKQFGDVVALEKELNDLTEWVKGARRELEDNQRSYAKEQEEFVARLEVAEDNGKEVHGFLERLQKENDELKALKRDLQHVLIYARVRNREAYD